MIIYGPAFPRARAEERGHEPHPDDLQPPIGPVSPRLAQWAHQGSPEGCKDCGVRCDICGDRMCSKWGPEPAARCDAHPTCVDCAEIPPCRDCGEAIRQAHEGSDW